MLRPIKVWHSRTGVHKQDNRSNSTQCWLSVALHSHEYKYIHVTSFVDGSDS